VPDRTDELLDRLVDRPDLRSALDDVHTNARRVIDAIDPAMDARYRDRIALLIGLTDASAGAPATERQRVCIDVVEQMVLDVTGVTDAQIATLAEHLGRDGAVSFVHAALAIEQRLRMRAMWQRLGLDGAA
jgi:uncharacterized protein YmfQ (DUF2313 family)